MHTSERYKSKAYQAGAPAKILLWHRPTRFRPGIDYEFSVAPSAVIWLSAMSNHKSCTLPCYRWPARTGTNFSIPELIQDLLLLNDVVEAFQYHVCHVERLALVGRMPEKPCFDSRGVERSLA